MGERETVRSEDIGYHTDAALGWTFMRPSHAAKDDGKLATQRCDNGRSLRFLEEQRPRIDALKKVEIDVPYGWNVPRYASNAIPKMNTKVQDPAIRLNGGATPHARFAQSEFASR